MFGTLIPRTERLPRPLVRFEREMENLMDRFFRPDEVRWLAEYKEGVLRISVPKTEKAKPRHVEVQG